MPRPCKILSDFDGVWTNQGPEASELLRYVAGRLSELSGVDAARAHDDVDEFLRVMRDAPAEHGWAPDGRISAYVDEDPLCEASALCRFIDVARDDAARRYRDAVLSTGVASLGAFAETCFREATAVFRDAHPPCLIEDAAEVLDALSAAGAEVVIVSNSSSDKIAAWFERAGIDAGEGPEHRLRLRGSAAKWMLGDTDDSIVVGHRPIHVDRPRYRAAIEEEQPDLIIGDVFSLDLALPHTMRRTGCKGAPKRLVLRRHDHTPDWIVGTRADGAIDHVITELRELASIL